MSTSSLDALRRLHPDRRITQNPGRRIERKSRGDRVEARISAELELKNLLSTFSTQLPIRQRRVEAAGIEPAIENDAPQTEPTSCVTCPSCGAANALHLMVTESHLLSLSDRELHDVLKGWTQLPVQVRSLIAATVRAYGVGTIPGKEP